MTLFGEAEISNIVNVATVPHRSPFRYPGGKTWLIPRIRQWLRSLSCPVEELIEPFASGAIVSLTAVFENLAKRATLVEIDGDITAVWETILNGHGQELADKIAHNSSFLEKRFKILFVPMMSLWKEKPLLPF